MFIKNVHSFKTVFCVLLAWLTIQCTENPEANDLAQTNNQDSILLALGAGPEANLDPASEIEVLKQAKSSLDDQKRNGPALESYAAIGSRLYRLKAYDDFLKLTNELQQKAQQTKDTLILATTYYDKANYFYFIKRAIDSAYSNYYNAQKLFSKTPAKVNAGKALLSMAIIQKNERDYVGSEESSIKAIPYFDQNTDQRFLSSVYNNLGIIAKEIGQYDRAIAYHKKALDYRKEVKDYKMLEVSSLSNIGVVYTYKKQYDEAVSYYEMGLAYDSLAQKRPKTYARLLDNLAYAQFKSGIDTGFPEAFRQPLQIRKSENDRLGQITSHLHLSEFFKFKDQPDSSLFHANKAYALAQKSKYNKGVLQSLSYLTELAPNEQARAFAKRHIAISDSLLQVERSYQDQFARTRYETDTLENEKEAATQRIRMLTLVLLGALIALLIGYIVIQQKINKTKMKFQDEQQRASDEITNLMMGQHAKLEEGKQLEKHRISEELHDGVLARLFGIRLNLDSLNASDDDEAVATRAKYLEDLKDLGREIRTISHELNAQTFDSQMLYVDVVEKMIEEQCAGLSYTFEADPDIAWSEVSNATKAHMYRIIQEGIQNVHKHADASQVSISFEKQEDGQIELSLTDNGKGMAVLTAKKGIGLKNIAARVDKINGSLHLDSTLGAGTRLSVHFN